MNMTGRYVSIWFPHLLTDRKKRSDHSLHDKPFVFVANEKGRRVIKAVDPVAFRNSIQEGMVLADCKAILPDLICFEFDSNETTQLLTAMAEWCIRYTPHVALDLPDG